VHGGSTARFVEGFRNIAERTKVPGWDQPDVDILKLVYNWLCDEANGRWLIIIDNADDISVFARRADGREGVEDGVAGSKSAALLDSLPQSPNGAILVTSRSREAAFRLTGNYADIIRVPPMDKAHALALLRNKLEGSFKQDDGAALVEALDYIPLAISQAAAYISQRAPRATMLKYLHDIRKGDGDRARLLDMGIEDSRRDGTASNSVMATWQISFEYIRRVRPSATQLLALMSLFDQQGIPEFLLNGRYQDSDDARSDFEDDLNTLMSFSLVAANVDGSQFEMHRLVQFSTRKWLELNQELEQWKETYVTLMDDCYPVGQYENWTVCQALFPHAQAVVECRPANAKALEAWASILFKAAWYASEMGQYEVAKDMDRSALEVREVLLGIEHPYTLTSVSNLAVVLQYQGKYEAAEEMNRRALEGREKALGKEHPDTLTSVYCLAFLFHQQHQYKDALTLYERASSGYKHALGPEHPTTVACFKHYSSLI